MLTQACPETLHGSALQEWAIMQREQERTRGERDIFVALARLARPTMFIVRLHCAFQDDKDLFMVLDYCPGGDIANQVRL